VAMFITYQHAAMQRETGVALVASVCVCVCVIQ